MLRPLCLQTSDDVAHNQLYNASREFWRRRPSAPCTRQSMRSYSAGQQRHERIMNTYQCHTKRRQRTKRPGKVQREHVVFLGAPELHNELPSAVVQHEVFNGLLLDAVFVELQHEVSRLYMKRQPASERCMICFVQPSSSLLSICAHTVRTRVRRTESCHISFCKGKTNRSVCIALHSDTLIFNKLSTLCTLCGGIPPPELIALYL